MNTLFIGIITFLRHLKGNKELIPTKRNAKAETRRHQQIHITPAALE